MGRVVECAVISIFVYCLVVGAFKFIYNLWILMDLWRLYDYNGMIKEGLCAEDNNRAIFSVGEYLAAAAGIRKGGSLLLISGLFFIIW